MGDVSHELTFRMQTFVAVVGLSPHKEVVNKKCHGSENDNEYSTKRSHTRVVCRVQFEVAFSWINAQRIDL